MVVLAQVFGLLSLLFMSLSYISKDKEAYLKKQIVANVLYGLQYLCLFALSGFITSVISSIKTILFHNEHKKKGSISLCLLLVFEVLYLISGILSYNGFISLIPVIISIIYTWASWQPNLKITCIVGIVVGLMWVTYNASVGAYIAIFSGVIESVSSAIGLVKQCKLRGNKDVL